MNTTVGQVMINAMLPSDLRDYGRVLDKKGVQDLMSKLADRGDPELYKKVVQGLYRVGAATARSQGVSFSIEALRTPPKVKAMRSALRQKTYEIMERPDLTPEQKDRTIIDITTAMIPQIEKTLYDESLAAGNPFAQQVQSGGRGGPGDLRSLLAGDIMVTDHRDRPIPVPSLRSYAEGLDPVEYWAGSYGSRRGTISTKLATPKSGFLAKQLVQAAHRQVVTSPDCGTDRGIPVQVDDDDNIGTVLQQGVGDIKAGTVIDAKVHKALQTAAEKSGAESIVVRSPLTCRAGHGVCARCAGISERGGFPQVGDNLGITAAQSLSERLSQGALQVKHTAGRATGKETTGPQEPRGFDLINQLVQVPATFKSAAAIAQLDGTVGSIQKAPQGGQFIMVGDERHYVPEGMDPMVKPGDRVEAGDQLSTGIMNPAELVKHKGLGAGRLAFVNNFLKAFRDSGVKARRRNVELLARGLVNHIEVDDLDGLDDALPGDILEYGTMESTYRPRYGFRVTKPQDAINNYLEKPAAHYSIGTRVTKGVANDLKKLQIGDVTVHRDPPPFRPRLVRAMEQASVNPDWQVRLGGSYLQRGLLESLQRGRGTAQHSTSYIPALARGQDFGETLEDEGQY